jgi:CBS domain containing-hemolysin-like protein
VEDARRAGIGLPAGEFETLGGYLVVRLGRIPGTGELHHLDGWEYEILEADPRRVIRVRTRPGSPTTG